MRNFSVTTSAKFHSYTINCGEYVNNIDVIEVLLALAAAFETEPKRVIAAWRDHVTKGDPFGSAIALAEARVLAELYEFCEFVRLSLDTDGVTTTTKVFVYTNLNTGATVCWVHSVC